MLAPRRYGRTDSKPKLNQPALLFGWLCPELSFPGMHHMALRESEIGRAS